MASLAGITSERPSRRMMCEGLEADPIPVPIHRWPGLLVDVDLMPGTDQRYGATAVARNMVPRFALVGRSGENHLSMVAILIGAVMGGRGASVMSEMSVLADKMSSNVVRAVPAR